MATDEHGMKGRVVRFLTKHQGVQPVEQWFLVGIDDDQKAMEAVSKRERTEGEVVEIAGYITSALSSQCSLSAGEVRLVLPGEPIT